MVKEVQTLLLPRGLGNFVIPGRRGCGKCQLGEVAGGVPHREKSCEVIEFPYKRPGNGRGRKLGVFSIFL